MLNVEIEEKRIEDFIDEIVGLCNQGKISKFITFDEIFEMAKKHSFKYYELLYYLDDRGFLIVSEK